MKLFATITSERATKGQGGSHLFIEIQGKKRNAIARIMVSMPTPNTLINPTDYLIEVYPVAHKSVLRIEQKGDGTDMSEKIQPDECRHDWDNYGKCCDCGKWNHQEKLKGKKQKGEKDMCRHIQKNCPICHK